MDETRHRLLAREIRRGIVVWKRGVEAWADGEPHPQKALIARAIVVALIGLIKGLAVLSGDGEVTPGSAQTLPRSRNRPPAELIDTR